MRRDEVYKKKCKSKLIVINCVQKIYMKLIKMVIHAHKTNFIKYDKFSRLCVMFSNK